MDKKYIALTFDDGPNTVTTPQVLEMLKKHNVTASFFLVGNNINEESAKVARECFMQPQQNAQRYAATIKRGNQSGNKIYQ